MNREEIFPCTILPTRYSGAYEGGKWAAFPLQPDQVQYLDWDASDTFAAAWWHGHGDQVGVGETPEAAYRALEAIPASKRFRMPRSAERKWRKRIPARSDDDNDDPTEPDTDVPARLSFVTLAVRDMPRMTAFYRQFGWPESMHSDESFVAFQTSGAVLGLFPAVNYEKELGAPVAPGVFKGFVLALNLEDATRVDALYEILKGFDGIRILGEPVDMSFGGRSFSFLDPDGSAWEVTWAEGTSFDERGGLIFP